MCGFLVIVSTSAGRPLPYGDDELVGLMDTLTHRGPDAPGLWTSADRSIALTHRRLEVIDLEGGQQPMVGGDGRYRLVYNGEIYNFRELRAELEGKGRRFHTRSDTEVLLAAYERWGPGCVSRLNGIFAFAVWDEDAGTLFMARDPIGVKPLYYGWWDGRFYVASEAKAIVADAWVPREIDPAVLDLYFHEGYVPAPLAIWKGMGKLGAGCSMTLESGGSWQGMPDQEPYYDLPFGRSEPLSGSEEELLDQLDATLRAAVARQTVSDVPLGAFLSGGVDSSLVVGYLAEHASGPVETFSVSFEDDPHDEAPFAEAVARKYDTRHHRIVVGGDRLADLERLAGTFDEPFADPAAVPTAILSDLARQHVTVVLSGDGGDETHAGYPRYFSMRQLAWIDRVPLALRRGLLGPLAAIAPSYRRRGGLEQAVRDAADRYDAMTRELPPVHRRAIYADGFRERLRDVEPGLREGARPWRRQALAELGGRADMLDRVQRLDLLTYLPEQLMTKLDRTSMAVSLEARVPLLDLEAVELSARMPAHLRMRDGRPKYLLRKLLARRMGENFGDRRKRGFTVPQHRWVQAQPAAALKEALLPAGIEAWFDPARLTSHVLESRRGTELAWPLLAFAHWFRHYVPRG